MTMEGGGILKEHKEGNRERAGLFRISDLCFLLFTLSSLLIRFLTFISLFLIIWCF